jgi:hypothetical protein
VRRPSHDYQTDETAHPQQWCATEPVDGPELNFSTDPVAQRQMSHDAARSLGVGR